MALELSEQARKAAVLEVLKDAEARIGGVTEKLGQPKVGGIEHNGDLHGTPGAADDDDMSYCPNCAGLLALGRAIRALGG